ncbi:isochorismatase family protein [Corynebacterium neomassiliense]|uniref:isochorismatase family protein n=1 Tax=Corynebacterium neomassiliense TaxID=2079482 RepID=UPI00192A3AFF|nr:isochorismatase family protein [Corynebacterium neomassiliense]
MLPTIESYSLPTGADVPDNRVDWRIDPSRAALLIHDMQQYFVDAFGTDSPVIAEITDHISSLREAAGAAGVPVFFTAQPPVQQPEQRGLLWDFWGPGIQDDGRHRIIDALSPTGQDTLLTKWRYDAFARSDFAQRLASAGRDQLLIVGVYAHIGCLTTAVSAFMQDIRPFLLSDALADFTRADHLATLEYVAKRCGSVLDTRTALEQIRRAPATDAVTGATGSSGVRRAGVAEGVSTDGAHLR